MVRGASSLYFSPPDTLTGKAARDAAVWRTMTWGSIGGGSVGDLLRTRATHWLWQTGLILLNLNVPFARIMLLKASVFPTRTRAGSSRTRYSALLEER